MFDDIRPYRDNEVAQVIQGLVQDPELQSSIAAYVMPKFYRLLPQLSRWLVKLSLRRKTRHFKDVHAIQMEAKKYMFRLIRKSTAGFSYQGIDQLDLSKPTLFVSNHRDIVLDPALVNMALHQAGHETVEIAIGDNLLSKKWVTDLMRLNKSFIVKRSEKTKRGMLTASKNLSAYIHHTLSERQQHIWIAQREGRAKDGLDKTNPAVISMLLLNKPKEKSISDYIAELNIVPVAISYEYDPCDSDKAVELDTIAREGSYQKRENEDITSITKGILGEKGRVHLVFGKPLSGDYESSKDVAAAIDEQIICNYHLFESNQLAFEMLHQKQQLANNAAWQPVAKRIANLTAPQQQLVMAMYANPLVAKNNLTI